MHKKFKNQYQFNNSFYGFVKSHVINDPHVLFFKDKSTIVEHPSNNNANHFFVNLSMLLDSKTAVHTIKGIFDYHGFDFNASLIEQCYTHYWHSNIVQFVKKG